MKALSAKTGLIASLLLTAAATLPAVASASPIDLRGDLCENRRPFNLNDVIARGDFVDVVRNTNRCRAPAESHADGGNPDHCAACAE